MQKDTYTTKVVFLMDQPDEDHKGGVFAFFPEENYLEWSSLIKKCYTSEIGINPCSVDYAYGFKLASKVRYAPLKAELEGLGYVLEVLTELPDKV